MATHSSASDSELHPSPVTNLCPNPSQSLISSITIQNIGSLVPIKLTTTNYLTWSALFAPIFRRYNLTGIVDGSVVAPPKFLRDSTGNRTSTVNPEFVTWYENDQNILIWINSTLSDSLIPYTVGVSSSRELWSKLESRLASASQSHIHELRSRLRTITKGDSTAAVYLQQIEEIADALASAGASVEDSELISVTLHGLPPDYDSFIDAIQFRLGSTTIDELHGLLLSKELQLNSRKKTSSASIQAFNASTGLLPTPHDPPFSQAYVAQHFTNFHQGRGMYRTFSHSKNFQPRGTDKNFSTYRHNNPRNNFTRQNIQRYNRGSRSHLINSGRRISCQICKQFDHEAVDCPHRLNPNYGTKSQMALCASTSSPAPTWLLDSGASSHMTNSYANLQNPESYNGPEQVYIGDGKGLPILHSGSSTLSTSSHNFDLKHVLHVPALKQDLLSANKFILDNSCSIHLYPFHFTVKDLSTEKTLFNGPVKDEFYPFHASSPLADHPHAFAMTSKASQDVWHQRLGHPSFKILNQIVSKSCISISDRISKSLCSSCALGKCSKLSFHTVSCHTRKPLELVHTDVWGPSPTISVHGFRYYIIFVDDFTKYSWLFPLKYKSEAFAIFTQFKSMIENLLSTKIVTLRSDSGGEFLSTQFSTFLRDHGISHQLSCPHTPEQNGCAERKHRHLIETARTLLVASQVPHTYWVEAFSTAIYLINRMPTALKCSPWESLFHRCPDYSTLRVFGCQCFPWLKPYNHSKLAPTSQSCVFLGYSLQHKGYKCLDVATKKLYISRHVIFHEHVFPFQHSSTSPSPTVPTPSPLFSPSIPSTLTFTTRSSSPTSSVPSPSISHPLPDSTSISPPLPPNPLPPPPLSQPLSAPNAHPMQTRSKSGISKPKAYTATKHPIPPHLTQDFIPSTYLQASKCSHWRQAMQEEFNALLNTGTWSLVPSHPSQNLVGCKWVFRIKRKPDGSIDRFKARLVAKGFHQQQGLDYTETFSPVAKPVTIRLLLTLASKFNWFLNQLDVSNAFLHGNLSESVFMIQPPGFEDPLQANHVCKLHKSLYGLKQAPRAWYEKLHTALSSLGFLGSQNDHSLFVKQTPDLVFILVYVDDILVTGPNSQACRDTISQLSALFLIKDLGPLHFFLGIEVKRSSSGIFISQPKYILDLLKRAHMDGAKPCATPLSTSSLDHTSPLLSNPAEYRSLVGGLQYLTWSRPDLSFAVNLVCQFMHQPRESHLQAVKRILRYLKGTIDLGLWFPKCSKPLSLTAFSDADWAGCHLDRRSTGGFCVFLGDSLISWSAKKQPTVARSSTEAEYRSLANTAAEITWICKLLVDVGLVLPCPPTLWCDNISAISLAKNPIFHARTKHVEIDYHYIREKVLSNAVSVQFVCSQDQLADICTKSLSKARFIFLRDKLSLHQPQFSLRGHIRDNIVTDKT
ncbi:hypothetical protein TB2_036145 [Malus domestica]